MSVLYPFPCETDSLRGVEADVYAAGFISLHPYWTERPDAGLSAVEIDVAPDGYHLSCTRLPWSETVATAREAVELATAWCARILDVGPSEVAGLAAFLPRVLGPVPREAGDGSSPASALATAHQAVDDAADAAPVPNPDLAPAATVTKRPRVDEVRDKLRAACLARGILGTRGVSQRMRLKRLRSKMGEGGE